MTERHMEAIKAWLLGMQEWEENHDRYKMAAEIIDHLQKKVTELEGKKQ